MDKFGAMRAFTRVVRLESYAAAGRSLGLTRSAVSKAVMELEQSLGARLLDRSTRRVSPTEAGRAYYERCLDILASVEETESQVASLHGEPRGVLRINAPVSFGALHLGPALADFTAAYPQVGVELTLNDRFVDPLEEGFDISIRIATLPDSSLVARRLAPARRVLVAAPAYLERHGVPQGPGELRRHACLVYGHATSMPRWELTQEGQNCVVPIASTFCANNGDVLRVAAIAGRGIALLPTFIVGPDIAAGRLRVVLPHCPPTALGIYALYTAHQYLATKTRAFIDFLAARFDGTPGWDSWMM